MSARAPRALTSARPCRKCKVTRGPGEYPLWADGRTVMSGWVIRFWCSPCLVAGGHITAKRAETFRRQGDEKPPQPKPNPWQEVAELAKHRVAQHKTTVALVERAETDPVFAAALLAAAEQVRVATSQPLSA